MGKLLDLSAPQFSHLQNGANTSYPTLEATLSSKRDSPENTQETLLPLKVRSWGRGPGSSQLTPPLSWSLFELQVLRIIDTGLEQPCRVPDPCITRCPVSPDPMDTRFPISNKDNKNICSTGLQWARRESQHGASASYREWHRPPPLSPASGPGGEGPRLSCSPPWLPDRLNKPGDPVPSGPLLRTMAKGLSAGWPCQQLKPTQN